MCVQGTRGSGCLRRRPALSAAAPVLAQQQEQDLLTIAVEGAAAAGEPQAIETVVVIGELLQREASRTATSVAVTSGPR